MPREIPRRSPPFVKFAPSVSELDEIASRSFFFTRIDITLIIVNTKIIGLSKKILFKQYV